MQNVNKLICLLVALLWIVYPCTSAFAEQPKSHKSSHKTHKLHQKGKKKAQKKKTKKLKANKQAKKKTQAKNKIQHSVKKHKSNTGNKKYKKQSKKHLKKTKKKLVSAPSVKQYPAQVRSASVSEKNEYTFVTSIKQRLVNFVHKAVSTFRYSAYKLGGKHVDPSHGIYIVDCSGFVDHTLRAVYPKAYLSIVDSSGTDNPNTLNYYDFFKRLSDNPDKHWSKVEDIEELQPGDILVFREKKAGRNTYGHIMVVMDQPERDGHNYLVSVADSAPIGHSEDTRIQRRSGIGIGKLHLKINPNTGQPSAYAWKIGSRFKHNVNFAMARPIG